MLRFITYALPLLILLLALFGFAVELLDAEPRPGSVIRLTLFEQPRVPAQLVLGAWLVEASGLLALFLLAQGRCGAWWLDGLVAGWLAWIFRGPLLVLTIVVAARQSHEPWWSLAFGWWVLYSVCGLALAWLARRTLLAPPGDSRATSPAESVDSLDPDSASDTSPEENTKIAAETEPVESIASPPEDPPVEESAEHDESAPDPPQWDQDDDRGNTDRDETDPSDDPTANGYETTAEEPTTVEPPTGNDSTVQDPVDAPGRGER